MSRIAQGGMGALYLAWDPMLERQIAIKLLRDDDDELRERFSNEARFVARLRHPRIVTIFDVGQHQGQPFIAMEYIQGQTLAEIIRSDTPLSLPHKLRLLEELCDGLNFAHRAGIVHRDVKPANLIVEADGSLKILDFGIARDGPGMTRAGMLIGTLNYMSPEQVLGRPVDQRSDIFAAGGVLYELLSSRQAFSGGLDSGVLNTILHQEPEPLAVLCPDLDPQIIAIVERALQKDPDRRYQEMPEMQRDLVKARRRLELLGGAEPATTRFTPAPVSPTPRPPRQDRVALERRRSEQIEVHLAAARSALASGDYEATAAACEQALLLDSQHPEAADLLDRAAAAIEAEQPRVLESVDVEHQREVDRGLPTLSGAALAADQEETTGVGRWQPADVAPEPGAAPGDRDDDPADHTVAATNHTSGMPAASGSLPRPLIGSPSAPPEPLVQRLTEAVAGAGMWMYVAAAVVVSIIAFTLIGGDDTPDAPVPAAVQTTTPTVVIAPPAPGAGAASAPSPSPAGSADPSAATPTPPAVTGAPSLPGTPATAAAPAVPDPTDVEVELEERLQPLRQTAQRQLDRGERRPAVNTIMAGLRLRADDPGLHAMLDRMINDAITAVQAARAAALSAGSGANVAAYQTALSKEEEGHRSLRRRPDQSLYGFWEAATLYTQAAEQQRLGGVRPPPAAPSPERGAGTIARGSSPPPAPAGPGTLPPPTTAPTAADRIVIRAVLGEYAQAFSAMSGERIRRLFPNVSAAFLEANFHDVKEMRLEISDMNITFEGTTAIVTVQERQRFTPGNGSRGQWSRSATYRLQKRGVNWMIVDRQSGEAR